MRRKKLNKNDMPEIKLAVQRLARRYGTQEVRASLAQFKGNDVIGCYNDQDELIGWQIADRMTGDIINEIGETCERGAASCRQSEDSSGDEQHNNSEQASYNMANEMYKQNVPTKKSKTRDKSNRETLQQDDSYSSVHPVLDNDQNKNSDMRRTKKHRVLKIIALAVTLLAVIGAGYTAYCVITGVNDQMNRLVKSTEFDYSQYTQVSDDTMARISIPSGGTAEDVRLSLCQSGMVECAKELIPALKETDNLGNIKQGNYIVTGSETGAQFARRIVAGKLVPDGVIGINDGNTLDEIAKNIDAAKAQFNGGDFLNATNKDSVEKYRGKYSMLQDVPADLPTLEGYIPSGEYNLNKYDTADQLIDNLLEKEQKKFEQSGKTSREWYEILTKASMIDKEALFDEDRAQIASVIDNRLERGMNLQIDATVKYANKSTEARVLNSDLEVDSPYNTYKHSGLPIGPICSGITQKSIDAVMNHEKTDYMYYVLTDKAGHHTFCKTADEFETARQKYMQIFGYTD